MNMPMIQSRVQMLRQQPAAVVARAQQAAPVQHPLQAPPNYAAAGHPDLTRMKRGEHPAVHMAQAMARVQALRSMVPPKGSGT